MGLNLFLWASVLNIAPEYPRYQVIPKILVTTTGFEKLRVTSEKKASELSDLHCEVVRYEERWVKNKKTGFRSTILCEDAPSPGILLYFNVDQLLFRTEEIGI